MAAAQNLGSRLAALPAGDRLLLKSFIGVALAALALGVAFGVLTAWVRAGFVATDPEAGYRLMTLHGVTIFFYWLYFAQAALLLALVAVFTEGVLGLAIAPLAWLGLAAMASGLLASLGGTLAGTPLLYDGSPEVVGEERGAAAFFYVGYLLLALGLVLVAAAAVATAIKGKLTSGGQAWSAVTFAAVAWAGLLMVSAIGAANTFLPAALWAMGWAQMPADHSTAWHILFHNMHYLPLMGTVLVWYVLVQDITGVGSIFGDRFSKFVFSLYLLFVPPTSLYHMFLEPGLDATVRVLGSLLSLLIGVPTVAVFLILVVSLEADARARGARGLFGWLRALPWRDPSMAALGQAVLNLAVGGVLSFVLIQERIASLLSDTFFVPGYFHFLTVGTVTLTLLAAFVRFIPPLAGGSLWSPATLARLPYLVTAGVVVFGVAGIAAGALGMPRRALDVGYDGAAPASWGWLSAAIGVGAAIMAAALAIYVYGLLASLVRRAPRRVPAAGEAVVPVGAGPAVAGQAAWTGPLSVVVLVAAMYVATYGAFKLMRALPLIAEGGGH